MRPKKTGPVSYYCTVMDRNIKTVCIQYSSEIGPCNAGQSGLPWQHVWPPPQFDLFTGGHVM